MANFTAARQETRGQQILDAAIACFARNGFHQTTMADIASEAGITPAAIYRYFGGKDDIIEASAQARQRTRAARFQAAEQRAGAVRVLDELLDSYLERVDPPDVTTLLEVQLFSEALRNPRVKEAVRTSWDDVLARFEDIVRRGQAQGEIDPALQPQAIARLLVAVYVGLLVQKTIDPDLDVWKCVEVLKALYSGTCWRGDVPAADGTS